MVLVAFEWANTHCWVREPLHATLKTFWTVLPSVSRQKVVPRFWNVETVHGWMITLSLDVAGNGQTMAPEGCGVGRGGQGGGHGGGQIGMTWVEAGAPV